MKTVIAFALTVVAATAHAESFNDRGDLFPTNVQPAASVSATAYVDLNGFNERSEYFIDEASAGSTAPKQQPMIALESFNDQGSQYRATTGQAASVVAINTLR